MILPHVIFKVRERDDNIEGDNPFKWVERSTDYYFGKGKHILFSLPGAFTPTCSTYQLPDFNRLYDQFKKEGIDNIYCISVNDSFVMNAWAKHHNIQNVKVLPDGNSEFTSGMGMLVEKSNLGFGKRSWRYVVVISAGSVEKCFEEPGRENNCPGDPYGVTSPQNILSYLKGKEYKEK